MPFTTATVAAVKQGGEQFRGVFSELWQATLTVDPASIAAGAEDTGTFTIPGLAVGDMVLGVGPGVNLTIDAEVLAYVSAANTLTIRISNLNAASALDLGSSTWKVVIGRPAF